MPYEGAASSQAGLPFVREIGDVRSDLISRVKVIVIKHHRDLL